MEFSTFQTNLSKLIQDSGKTSKDIAVESGISAASLSRYLNGHNSPDLECVYKLAAYFNVSIEWLLGLPLIPFNTQIEQQYFSASPSDRKVVDLILNKYK